MPGTRYHPATPSTHPAASRTNISQPHPLWMQRLGPPQPYRNRPNSYYFSRPMKVKGLLSSNGFDFSLPPSFSFWKHEYATRKLHRNHPQGLNSQTDIAGVQTWPPQHSNFAARGNKLLLEHGNFLGRAGGVIPKVLFRSPFLFLGNYRAPLHFTDNLSESNNDIFCISRLCTEPGTSHYHTS